MVSLQSVMVAKHFNCVHITPDNLVVESDSKAAKKVQVVISLKYCTGGHETFNVLPWHKPSLSDSGIASIRNFLSAKM